MEFKNTSGEAIDLPTLDLRVQADETFTATGQDAKNLEGNPDFTRTDKPVGKTNTEEK